MIPWAGELQEAVAFAYRTTFGCLMRLSEFNDGKVRKDRKEILTLKSCVGDYNDDNKRALCS